MEKPIDLPANADRISQYTAFLPQAKALVHAERDAIAAMANLAAAIYQGFGWHWVGFYRVIGNELVLGPFQGPVACSRIGYGKGVCGTAWQEDRLIIVPDVEQFPGHIACSALSRSELVIPIHDQSGEVRAVLDIDSVELNGLGTEDAHSLKELCKLLEPLL